MKKVSVIIIIYKVGRFLKECLESVIAQTYDNLEIICVVGSTDTECVGICDEYEKKDSRIIVLKEEPKGTAAARNAGLDRATGDFIAFVDGDDYIDSDMIEVMVTAALKYDAQISVVGKYYTYENLDEGESNNRETVMNTEEALRQVLYQDGFFLHIWDKLYIRELFSEIRFPVGKRVEDRQLATKLLCMAERIVYNSASKYHFRVSEDSGSRIEDNLRLSLNADYELCDELKDRFPSLNDAVRYFLVCENMSVLQNSMIFGTYSPVHDREYLEYIKKNSDSIKTDSHYERSLAIKIFLAKRMPEILKIITVSRRNKFLDTHISFKTGADWEKTFKEMEEK